MQSNMDLSKTSILELENPDVFLCFPYNLKTVCIRVFWEWSTLTDTFKITYSVK